MVNWIFKGVPALDRQPFLFGWKTKLNPDKNGMKKKVFIALMINSSYFIIINNYIYLKHTVINSYMTFYMWLTFSQNYRNITFSYICSAEVYKLKVWGTCFEKESAL